jgi:3-isopropylmalate/(R)-2-methylmalate dehydratase large subunit
MGMTAIEKVLALKSGRNAVRPGDVVYPDPDFVMIHDGVVMSVKQELDAIGITRIAAPGKLVMVTDHEVIYGSARAAQKGAFNRAAAREWGVTHFYDVGRGGHGHIFPLERGMLLPGMFYFDNDRHATNAGAIGAFGFRMGGEISRVLATGTNWVVVPKSVRIRIRGQLKPGVYGRDLGFHIARQLRERGIDVDYRVIEFTGELEQFSLAARVALCSSPTEMRAYGVYFPPSEAVLAHARAVAQRPFTPVYPDADAVYETELEIDAAGLEPQVALPGAVHRAVDVSAVAGTRVEHAFIGSCGSGMYEDLQAAARILCGRRIAPHVRLFVAPGSEDSMKRALREGLATVFVEAGAVMLPPGCGPCNEAVVGPLHSGEVSISTAAANNPGKMGAKDAQLYLGSPATVAASAVAGAIADARGYAPSELPQAA